MAERGAPLGNNNGGKNKPITEAIIKSLHEECELEGGKTKKLYALARKLVDRAVKDGDLQAIKEVLDRVEGKPAQAVAVSGEIEVNPLTALLLSVDGVTRGIPEDDRTVN